MKEMPSRRPTWLRYGRRLRIDERTTSLTSDDVLGVSDDLAEVIREICRIQEDHDGVPHVRMVRQPLNLKSVEKTLLDEPIPGGASWIYVFGSATLFLFGLQAITGMFLAIYYAPTPDHAYDSVQFIENQVTFGWFVRGLHHWGASGMMIAVGLHMLQVFLYGAYKPPRELMWMVGVVLLLIVLAFAFTGYLLPWDQTAYWATQVGINMVGTVPLVGDFLIKVLRGGETLGALTLSRFFAVHVLFLPAVIITGIALHMIILRRVGPAGPWDERKAAARREAFYPRQVYMDAVVMLCVFLALAALATWVPFPLADKANPSDTSFVPVPEWYFLFYYELLKHIHGPFEPLVTWVLPIVFVLIVLFWPFLDWKKTVRAPASRPIGMTLGAVFLLIVFSLLGVSLKNLYAVKRAGSRRRSRQGALYPIRLRGLPPDSRGGRSLGPGLVLCR